MTGGMTVGEVRKARPGFEGALRQQRQLKARTRPNKKEITP